ncbi:hypothetical protein JTB14_003279 [Gonioctena quinquepunctata]|nr:hypothetical protein JTB14_003279 [Gonioctena quinquepunctata]
MDIKSNMGYISSKLPENYFNCIQKLKNNKIPQMKFVLSGDELFSSSTGSAQVVTATSTEDDRTSFASAMIGVHFTYVLTSTCSRNFHIKTRNAAGV